MRFFYSQPKFKFALVNLWLYLLPRAHTKMICCCCCCSTTILSPILLIALSNHNDDDDDNKVVGVTTTLRSPRFACCKTVQKLQGSSLLDSSRLEHCRFGIQPNQVWPEERRRLGIILEEGEEESPKWRPKIMD